MGVARAYIKFDVLVNAFVDDNFLSLENNYGDSIPQDAEILNGGYDEKSARFFVDFEHPKFRDFQEIEVQPDLRFESELFTSSEKYKK